MNAAAALLVAGKVDDLKAGAATAGEAVDSGAAREVCDRLVAISNEEAPAS
jgi:anthranilate phosphoribosyltransferase